MISVTFDYYVKIQDGSKELELQVVKNKDNRHVITRIRENPKLQAHLWCTRHASADYNFSNRCTLTIHEGAFTAEQMTRCRWKKVTSIRKEKIQTETTTETIF